MKHVYMGKLSDALNLFQNQDSLYKIFSIRCFSCVRQRFMNWPGVNVRKWEVERGS